MSCWSKLTCGSRPRCERCALLLPEGSVPAGPGAGCCAHCAIQAPPFDRAVAAVDYDAHARLFLLRVKNGHRPEVLRPLAAQLAAVVSLSRVADGIDGIVPVPSSLRARWQRGFNPAGELARELARASDIPLLNAVLRKRGLRGTAVKRLRRETRSLHAGRGIVTRHEVPAARILLVDDVLTTGATAAACATALRAAGAAEVRVAVWARTPSRAAGFDRLRGTRL